MYVSTYSYSILIRISIIVNNTDCFFTNVVWGRVCVVDEFVNILRAIDSNVIYITYIYVHIDIKWKVY